MKSITINGSQRESVGKKSTKALRNAGQVPCVLYGGDQNVHFSAPELAFSKLVYTPNAHTVVIALDNGDTYDAVLQDIQFHPVTDRILHIDFYRLFEDKEIAMDIPVHVIGTSRGVLNGGVLRKNRRKLRVKALPKNLPDFLEADITPLKIGNKLYVTALEGEGYKLLHSDNTVVVQIKTARTAIIDDEDEEEDELEEGAETTATEGGETPAAEASETQE
ncbi:50S ribosomal protein L25/general stress protein Ctc [Psychroserpens sp. SPM9]|uniref:50S ribosomal protein L25/general stress protein Ctc n=1 Tax=Psychroserpens sp. SPM9 TaxID=2975598 RepID=UPI0021A2F07E|nr:50S ribosomal protein L25/general stress protein Ctc [Psychroserpens sp. SPM9]MDG5490833.1 50S ribosomal protein L25/general stress protein Ctc [Psychroserpens sp. SPM9]